MTRKIAILTQPLHSNYGGILQCYALQTVLERMGCEVTVLNRRWVAPKVTFLLFILRCVSMLKCVFRRHVLGRKEWHVQKFCWQVKREVLTLLPYLQVWDLVLHSNLS